MLIVGLNAYHGDVAAVVVRDGRLIAALEEERFCRIKHVAGFPARAIARGLEDAGAVPANVDIWAVARGRRVHLLRKAWFALTHRPGAALLGQYRNTTEKSANIPKVIAETFSLPIDRVRERTKYIEHHPAHLASAFRTSGLTEAACCAIDGFGDFVSVSVAHGRGDRMDVIDRVYFPHSLGLLYLAITQHLGFKKYGDEYKVMGLAPYGTPSQVDAIQSLVRLEPGGRFSLDLDCFRHWTGEIAMSWASGEPTVPDVYSERLIERLGPARRPDEPVTKRHEDIAASIQRVFEDAAFHVLRGVHEKIGVDALCLAGGCAMNSVANGKIRQQTPFKELFIQPAAGDNGTALGAALEAWHTSGQHATGPRMGHAYWGTEYSASEIANVVKQAAVVEQGRCSLTTIDEDAELYRQTAARIAGGAVIGWYQGRMEWGARALGNRSILADPRRRDMRDIINQKIKFRERFRPFAPSILAEAIDDYFVGAVHDPFMIQVYPVRPEKRDVIPAVTHVDGSGRLQSVSRDSNPRYWALIDAFRQQTGVPVLLNTSFNENEPIVERPEQALECFLRTDMDVLVMGPHLLSKHA
ncbi:MAG TPA: carbamoyltransferase C-terminal domain-containing protein [Vicinamibacterales bacterium]|nr:carbamoyltransferase C-terminal domain-containing protein [Vicinamibacterales bacterium]